MLIKNSAVNPKNKKKHPVITIEPNIFKSGIDCGDCKFTFSIHNKDNINERIPPIKPHAHPIPESFPSDSGVVKLASIEAVTFWWIA